LNVINLNSLEPAAIDADARKSGGASSVWSSIENAIADDITSGRLTPGDKLAGEHQLAERFGVNRHTVRHALGKLAAKGLVDVRHGLGTFVADIAVDYVLGRRTRFTENLSAAGLRGTHRLVESSTIKANAQVASGLRLRAGTLVHLIVAIGEANGRPITIAEHYFPAKRFKGLPERFTQTQSVSRTLATFGVEDFTRERSVISARMPSKPIAGALKQSVLRPVLYVEAINVDADGVPIELGRSWFVGDLVQLIVSPEH
jgi:GntR family transcriptional regulator, phosphonate transport system regulatory protein